MPAADCDNVSDSNREQRRDFLKTSAAAGAALLASSSLQSGAYAAGDEKIRIGLVGCGGRGTGAARQALNAEPNAVLVAMGDLFPDHIESRLKTLQKQSAKDPHAIDVPVERQFSGFDAYQKVIDSDVDLVILATPPGFRPEHFEYAVNAGKHIFMEKPVATDGPGIRRVLKAVEESKKKNLMVAVGLQRRHEPKYHEALDILNSGKIGDLMYSRVYWNSGGVWDPRRSREQVANELEYQLRNWYYYTWICGDHIVEQHIHNLDVGCWFKGSYPVEAIGMGGRQVRTDKKYGQIFDHFAVQYEFEDGTHMFSECRHIRGCMNAVTEKLRGSKGEIDMTRGSVVTDSGEKMRIRGAGGGHQLEHYDLFGALRNGDIYNEGEYGAMSTLTAILGRMATYSGKKVTMEQALNSEVQLVPETMTWDSAPPILPDDEGRYPVAVPGQSKVV
ncbi:Gfo/Idh/MocA family protein [Calycomorphotria hydatis]|uniref:Inositol 2-dehydrogenase n=1 Tax=Calycomorphotria hydatis TaxID=2528027 RepID=A0A517T9I0_9PLAN|nr:Gfo/Idh/MocA family oxidoreductase [Calycomorphotria hydatis]QDT65035.1 Inositol 2-dehydrogenase [Calycomorphotria hydatis]